MTNRGAGPLLFEVDGFEDYAVDTSDSPAGLVSFCSIYVGVCVSLALFMACCWRGGKQKGQQQQPPQQEKGGGHQEQSPSAEGGDGGGEQEMVPLEATTTAGGGGGERGDSSSLLAARRKSASPTEDPPGRSAAGDSDGLLRPTNQQQQTNGTQPPLQQPATSSMESQFGSSSSSQTRNRQHQQQQQQQQQSLPAASTEDPLSPAPSFGSVPGAAVGATTTAARRRSASAVSGHSDLSRSRPTRSPRPWGHARPLGRADLVSRTLASERQSLASEEGSHGSRRSKMSYMSGTGHHHNRMMMNRAHHRAVMSDAASHMLDEEVVEGEAEFYRNRYLQRSRSGRGGRGMRRPSTSETDNSLMPPLSPDVLSPEDAADAHDRGRSLTNPEEYSCFQSRRWGPIRHVFTAVDQLLVLAETDYESGRILSMATLSTIGAVADPLFRLVLLAIISHFVDTDSMVAFVFVNLFIRLTTEEIAAAITDVESNLVKDALFDGGDAGFTQAGRCVRMAMVMQILVGVPVLLVWAFVMEDMVDWLVSDNEIARIASKYAKVIIVDYILRGTTRAYMLPFHLSGQGQFERNIDVVAALLTLTAIVVVASMAQSPGEPSLDNIGWIQVIIGVAKTIIKVAFVAIKGWLQPYREGLIGSPTQAEPAALWGFFLQVVPLFLGSLVELGEWDILVLFVGHLGGAEASGWAVMGVVWEVCLASTEGLGEAASVRLSFLLGEGFPAEAKLLASKVAFLACIEAMVVTSVLLMAGPNIAVALTKDSVLENILNNLIGLTALANVSMTFAQVYWSLAGAQGSYGVASATILLSRWLVTIPIALICVFVYSYDVDTLAGAVAVGYATAALVLSIKVFNSDWMALSIAAQQELMPLDDDVDGLSLGDDDDDDDDSSGIF